MSIKAHNVLVVDDDPTLRDMVVDILDFEGYEVETARNGREALEKLRGAEGYLILLDLMMPVMDGREFCERLNTVPYERNKHIVVLMSAMNKSTEFDSLCIDALLPKPFMVDDILRVITPFMA